MARSKMIWSLFALALPVTVGELANAADSLGQRVHEAITRFEGSEDRFLAADPDWFEITRQALQAETERVGAALDSHGKQYSAAWKKHLRWPLLTGNLGDPQDVELAELALVRRWLYSNRKGLEYPFFAELRTRIDAHLDAVYTFTQHHLEADFRRQIGSLRQQLQAFAKEPSDARAAALGRTLAWFEKTRQLPDETAAVRSLLSYPNAQVVVGKPLIDRTIALFATEVEQSLPVSDRVTVPHGSLFGRSRVANVHGIARTHGQLAFDLAENSALAELQLVYQGEIESRCRAVVGPVTVAMQTLGSVRAVTPIQVSLQGIQLFTTKVVPEVRTQVTSVSARSRLIRRIGERRVHKPESTQQMNSRAREKSASLLQSEMDDRVTAAIEEIRAEMRHAQTSLDNFQDVLAPVVREGATPRWAGIQSSAEGVTINVASQRREQFGAPTPCPLDNLADLQVRMHVSFFNNMAETIMAGKTFTDKYFMNYGKILQPTLPPPLMVHARSVRWSMIAAKPRPLEITIPAPNQFRIRMTMQRVEIGDEQFTGPTVATINYLLRQNEFEEYQLERQGDVELDSPMPAESQAFLLQKLGAFFAPILNGGGVALPEGGTLGRLRGLSPQGVTADQDWLTLGINVPQEFLAAWLPIASE